MARLPLALLILANLILWGEAWGQSPDKVLGTGDGQYRLYDPGDVVKAGASDAAPTYRFFSHTDIAAQAATSGDLPLTLTILAPTRFESGLQTGPFHTQYEGSLSLLFSTGAAALTIEVATKHTFENGKSLTTKRVDTERVNSNGSVFALSQFSSVTALRHGDVTLDDGSTLTVTDAILAAPVTVGITVKITATAAETISDIRFSSNAGVTLWQLRDPILAAGGGGGTATPLSDATPKVESGSGAAGSATAASRGDHVHPARSLTIPVPSTLTPKVAGTATIGTDAGYSRGDHVHPSGGGGSATPLSDATPKALGTAAAGSATSASRGDHVHKRPTEIAENTAAIATQAAEDVRLKAAIVSVENDIYRPSGNLKTGDVLTAVDCKGSPVANCMSEWKAPPSGGGTGGNLPAFAGAGKHLATNADDDGAEWVTPPPDLTDQVGDNSGAIEDLNFLTQDMVAGTPSTAWATVTDASNAGIALFNGAASCNAARGATYVASVSSGVAGKFPIVRVKAGFALANVRIQITGQGTATDLISGWVLLCTSSDGGFAYYHDNALDGAQAAFGTGVTAVAVQTTGGAHVGTSKYLGDPTQVERWAIVGNAAGVPITKTLPSVTGHGGNCLKVNSAASGAEWAACGGGSGGGGGSQWSLFKSAGFTSRNFNSTQAVMSFDATEFASLAKLVKGGVLFGLVLKETQFTANRYEGTAGVGFAKALETDKSYLINFAMSVRRSSSTFYSWQCRLALFSTSDASIECRTNGAWTVAGTAELYYLELGGGGGGSSGPSIPSPTAAGKLQHLRVNAAGAAYELTDPYSTAAPKPPGTAAAGTAQTLSRSDHVHALPTIPQGSTDTPTADSATGAAGTSNKWSPSDHSHPITGHDSVTWSQVAVSSLTGGGASGGVDCDGSLNHPTAQACKALTDAFRRGDYNFFAVRVARFDDNDGNEPLHTSGCVLLPGIPGAIFSGSTVAEAACTANSGKNSANSFNQYDVFAKFGNDGNYIQVRLPNYNSYGVTAVTVTVTGIR